MFPLNSAQAQALIDANQGMIDGGAFTVSEVSFRLACMKVLGTLQDRFSIKSWRVLDDSDETGNRYVQASMQLSIGDTKVVTTRAEGAGPVDGADQGNAPGIGKVVPSHRAHATRHLHRHSHRRIRAGYRGPRPRHGKLQRRRSRTLDHCGSEQRS